MLIVIEGCDCTAKTSLANLIVKRTNGRLLHFGPPERHPLLEYEDGLAFYRPGEETVVCDRLHLGELVYGPLYRQETLLGTEGLRHVNLFLRSRGASLVVATASGDVVRQRMRDRGEDYLQADHVDDVLAAFRNVTISSMGVLQQVATYDSSHITDATLAANAWAVIADAATRELDVLKLREHPGYIGSPTPTYLLLGDAQNERQPRLPGAFGPWAGSCGRYLLDVVGPWAGELGLANATEVDVSALWHALGHPYVVAMGNVAQDVCRGENVPYRATAHPQYWRRFRHHEVASFRRELFEVTR